MVGITPMRRSPVSGWPWARARSASSSLSRSTRLALSAMRVPSGVKRTTRLVRSTSIVPSRLSSSRRPADRVDWVTKQASAARPKWPCSRSATRYCSCLMVGRWPIIDSSDLCRTDNRFGTIYASRPGGGLDGGLGNTNLSNWAGCPLAGPEWKGAGVPKMPAPFSWAMPVEQVALAMKTQRVSGICARFD